MPVQFSYLALYAPLRTFLRTVLRALRLVALIGNFALQLTQSHLHLRLQQLRWCNYRAYTVYRPIVLVSLCAN